MLAGAYRCIPRGVRTMARWLVTGYGGKRAFLRHVAFRAEAAIGRYDALTNIDFPRVERLVFVCKGNLCRSPFAEYSARREGFSAISAGLDAAEAQPADPAAVNAARRRGIDLEGHRSRRFDPELLQPSDLVIAFEPAQAAHLGRSRLGSATWQVGLLGLFASTPFPYLHDPYGLSAEYFDRCFSRIEDALLRFKARQRASRVSDLE